MRRSEAERIGATVAGDTVAVLRWPAPGNSRLRPERRPRASLANSHSGGTGAPPGDTTVPRLEQADDLGWNTQAKARPGAGRKTPQRSAARRAPYVIGRVAPRKARQVERLAVLRPLRIDEAKRIPACPAPPQKPGRRSVGFARGQPFRRSTLPRPVITIG